MGHLSSDVRIRENLPGSGMVTVEFTSRCREIRTGYRLGVRSSFLVFLLFGDLFGDHTDGRVVQPKAVSHFLQCVLMDSNGLVDLLVPRCLVMYVLEKHHKAGSRCKALVPRDFSHCELLVEERADLLDEGVCAKEIPSSKVVPDRHSSSLVDEPPIRVHRT